MGLRNLFKRDKAEDKQPVSTFEPEAPAPEAAAASAGEPASAEAAGKKRHGEPGVCCGSCSH
ncbi:CCGSCS motif protein [Halomonas sp. MCCC 1A17488]|uniref:CCGSCS motif protein n=1 Tax=Billgrantia sulfidoxydans TaxID=2733484 RepID=A0ABX7W831_9GAMM|nr:CCGSCS motif protein [Halomonas sp. MCCC 1A17488]MCG3237814.1 CCGSCS motif protein [Halomonas sp. MCCC 1A17488]QPP48390.1 CCGSCS motif protein [Halomonas sp. SS10-MC5]QTP55702.1 CCGSCS motif protein [Halomonas sulfidoxydans]